MRLIKYSASAKIQLDSPHYKFCVCRYFEKNFIIESERNFPLFDPNQAITGKYQPCSGNKTRKDYDLCLSQERSKVIADRLNKALPELGNAFKFKGMGETNHFNGVGWTKENPTIPDETAPNRAYTLSPIKPFMATQ